MPLTPTAIRSKFKPVASVGYFVGEVGIFHDEMTRPRDGAQEQSDKNWDIEKFFDNMTDLLFDLSVLALGLSKEPISKAASAGSAAVCNFTGRALTIARMAGNYNNNKEYMLN
jgi:hypothetical protein